MSGRNGNNIAAIKRKMPVGVPFVKGDPRCWRKGRPRSFDQARLLAQAISHEKVRVKGGRSVTVAEEVFRKLVQSNEPQALRIFLEYAFGKPPDRNEISGAGGEALQPMVIQVITQTPANRKVN